MVLYKCEVQADLSWFIKLKFSKVFYKYCCFCLNVGVGIALILWQPGNADVPRLRCTERHSVTYFTLNSSLHLI